jgi:type IV pilus assembly protein PilA
MKNNKGVTLVELLIVIVVMGIISAFAIPAVGQIIQNTQKDAILADALAMESAAKLYCSQTTCDTDQDLTWTQLQDYVEGIDASYYDFTNNTGIVATKSGGSWTIDLEATGTGEWEFTQGAVPSASDRDQVVADND